MTLKSKPHQEKKLVHFEVKAEGVTVNSKGQEVGVINAFGAIYGNVDLGRDRVLPGASKRTIIGSKKRAEARNLDYILPMIWNHDTEHFMPVGGWFDVDGNDPEGLRGKAHVLLSTQAGHDYYELAKAGMVDTFSVIYDIPEGGAKYDKSGVREISEWRIFSIDPVIFPMNEETRTISVKNAHDKGDEAMVTHLQRKTLQEHYNEEIACDLLEDWQDVYVSSLTKAVFDAFTIGDQPESDVSDALDAFKELVLSKFVTQAIEVDLSGYLESNSASYTPGLSAMQNGSDDDGYYSYMSRRGGMARKEGRSISAANQDAIDSHVKAVKAMARKAKADMTAHVSDMHDAIADMAGEKGLTLPGKAGRSLSASNAEQLHGMADKAMSIVADHAKSLTGAAQDLTNTLYAEGNKPGYADEDDDTNEKSGLERILMSLKAIH